jgi:hypothetical protein
MLSPIAETLYGLATSTRVPSDADPRSHQGGEFNGSPTVVFPDNNSASLLGSVGSYQVFPPSMLVPTMIGTAHVLHSQDSTIHARDKSPTAQVLN